MRVLSAPYGDLWQVGRVDTMLLTAEQRAEVFAWLAGLGIPYTQMIPTLVVSQDATDKQLLLHLSRQARDLHGDLIVDHAAGRVHTEPVAFTITDYPPFLVGVSQQQQAEREASHGGPSVDQ